MNNQNHFRSNQQPPKSQKSHEKPSGDDKDEEETVEISRGQYINLINQSQKTQEIARILRNPPSLSGSGNRGRDAVDDVTPPMETSDQPPTTNPLGNQSMMQAGIDMNTGTTQETIETFRQFTLWSGIGSLTLVGGIVALSVTGYLSISLTVVSGVMLLAASGIFLRLWYALFN